jgi:hypothetical protein
LSTIQLVQASARDKCTRGAAYTPALSAQRTKNSPVTAVNARRNNEISARRSTLIVVTNLIKHVTVWCEPEQSYSRACLVVKECCHLPSPLLIGTLQRARDDTRTLPCVPLSAPTRSIPRTISRASRRKGGPRGKWPAALWNIPLRKLSAKTSGSGSIF